MSLPFVCPSCRSPLESRKEAFRCPACGRGYPVLFGIPDLRIKGDRYLNLEADRGRAEELDRAAREGASFDDLLELYWRNTPGTPPAIAARHVAGVRRSVEESRPILGALSGGRLLDAGCGSGGALLAAARSGRFSALYGVDTALRWLVIARARLAEAGLAERVTLAAAAAEALPFPEGAFDSILLRHLLEHVPNPPKVLEACARALAAGGLAGIETFHRWAPTPEPHVGLLGAAWLPRRLQALYVRWRRGDDYSAVRLLSRREIVRAVERAGLTIGRFVRAPTTPGQREALPRLLRPLAPVHDLLGSSPRLNRIVLSRVGPVLRLVARKGSPRPA